MRKTTKIEALKLTKNSFDQPDNQVRLKPTLRISHQKKEAAPKNHHEKVRASK